MNNEIEEITDLFDEFFIIDSPDEISADKPVDAAVKPASDVPVKETAEHVINTPQNPLPPESPVKPEPQIPLAPLNFSGANKRHITVIYNDKNNDSRENVEMLSNLVTKALKLSMDDVAIVRLSRNPEYSLSMIFNTLNTKHAMIWGAFDLLKAENNNTAIHQTSSIGSTLIMVADEAHTYHDNTAYKTALWQAIQTLLAQ